MPPPDPAFDREVMARFRPEAVRQAAELLQAGPSFVPTPLRPLDGLAQRLGLAALWAKDETERWHLGSFKALGGAYAVLTLCAEALAAEHGRKIAPLDVLQGKAPAAPHIVYATATAGNHGCAVAYGANLARARAVIFVYEGVPTDRIKEIAQWGAEIVQVPGNYEAAHRACLAQAAAKGWTLVCDQAWPGYEEIPLRIMQGYSVLFDEIKKAPTHVFVQAGVGGLAAAAACFFAGSTEAAPKIVVVEARTAPCLMESAVAQSFVASDDKGPTTMGRLDCRVPSSVNWPILAQRADAFVAVDDDEASAAMFDLVSEGIVSSPSGSAGLAGLNCVMRDDEARTKLALGRESRVLIVATEKATAADNALIGA